MAFSTTTIVDDLQVQYSNLSAELRALADPTNPDYGIDGQNVTNNRRRKILEEMKLIREEIRYYSPGFLTSRALP